MTDRERYRVALLDWLACAFAGTAEPVARAARAAGDSLLESVTAVGCAGHVLDYDDTYTPGLVHATAPVRAGGAVAGGRPEPRPRDGARRVRCRMGGDGGAGAREPPRAVRTRMAPDRGLRNGRGGDRLGTAPRSRRGTDPRRRRARPAARGRPASGLRVARQVDPGRRRGGRRAPGRTPRGRGCAGAARRPRARPGGLRGRLRRDVGRAAAMSRRSGRTGSRPIRAASGRTARSRPGSPFAVPASGPSESPSPSTRSPGRRLPSTTPRTACRRSSRSPT